MSKIIITATAITLVIAGIIVFILLGQKHTNLGKTPAQFSEIVLVLVNSSQTDAIFSLQEKLQKSFHGVTVKTDDAILTLPDELLDKDRQQYNSQDVLNFIHQYYSDRPSTQIVIGVTEDEIYSGNLNFAFSSGDKVNKVGVISTAYFYREIQMPTNRAPDFKMINYAEEVVVNRSYKTALRIIGGMVGLSSGLFQSSDCAMSFSNTLPELDEKGTEWCGDDEQALKSVGLIN